MKPYFEKRSRRSIRLSNYDYGQAGAYFVTVCSAGRECLFGEVSDEETLLSSAGLMVANWWNEIPHKFSSVAIDACVVMPNHLHGIVLIVGADLCVCPHSGEKPSSTTGRTSVKGAHAGAPLPRIIQWFKTMTTNEYIRHVKQQDWPPFAGRLRQRNYYEHVIRDDESLDRIREDISTNPLRWALDRENPHRTGTDDFDAWLGTFRKHPLHASVSFNKHE